MELAQKELQKDELKQHRSSNLPKILAVNKEVEKLQKLRRREALLADSIDQVKHAINTAERPVSSFRELGDLVDDSEGKAKWMEIKDEKMIQMK